MNRVVKVAENVTEDSADCVRLRQEIASLKAQLQVEQQRFDELSHRVKNELQVFLTLFSAQRVRCRHPDDCAICVSRVAAGAALHKAFDSDGIEHFRLGKFVSRLSELLHTAFDGHFDSVVTVDGDVEIDCLTARCVGLVYVEATMNALKHGFAGATKGRIETRLVCADGEAMLIVENNGARYHPGSAGRGVRLMEEMAAQLKGKVEIIAQANGAATRLTFPIKPKALRHVEMAM